jgi:hypothetical protein
MGDHAAGCPAGIAEASEAREREEAELMAANVAEAQRLLAGGLSATRPADLKRLLEAARRLPADHPVALEARRQFADFQSSEPARQQGAAPWTGAAAGGGRSELRQVRCSICNGAHWDYDCTERGSGLAAAEPLPVWMKLAGLAAAAFLADALFRWLFG